MIFSPICCMASVLQLAKYSGFNQITVDPLLLNWPYLLLYISAYDEIRAGWSS